MEACALNNLYCAIIQKTMSPRKSEEDVVIKFRKSYKGVCEGTNLVKILQSYHFNNQSHMLKKDDAR